MGNKYVCEDMTACDEEILNRLAELEDKIEKGTLIELPCKVGDTVYVFDSDKNGETKISEEIVKDYSIDSNGFSVLVQEREYTYFLSKGGLGVDWFLTKAEAEAKLKELQNER
jgi:hypothetical protein